MEENINYMQDWREYCEENGLDYEENAYLEGHWQEAQEKIFGFILKLLI